MPKFDWQGWIKTLWPVGVGVVAIFIWMERIDAAVNLLRLELQADIKHLEVKLFAGLDTVQQLYIPLAERCSEVHTQITKHEALHWHAPTGERMNDVDEKLKGLQTDLREIRQDVKTLLRRSNGNSG